jgi:lantibiotic modifying enzyme
MISADAIRRGSYPGYDIGTLSGQNNPNPGGINATANHTPDWLTILPSLISPAWIAAADAPLLKSHANLVKINPADPYRCAFNQLAGRFMVDWLDCYETQLSDKVKHIVPASLARECIDLLMQSSRYALHTTHISSGESWSVWSNRFNSGQQSNRNPWIQIAEEFPVLINRLFRQYQNYLMSFEGLFTRLMVDRKDLDKRYNIQPRARISSINGSSFLAQLNSHSSMKLVFEDGTKLIYKQKPVDIDLAFNRLVLLGELEYLSATDVLSGPGYGWIRTVEKNDTTTHPLNKPEYTGAAAALFWLLNSTGTTLENMMANHRGICVPDLDTLICAPAMQLWSDHEQLWRNHSNIPALFCKSGRIEPGSMPASGKVDTTDVKYWPIEGARYVLIKDRIQTVVGKNNQDLAATRQVELTPSEFRIARVVNAFRKTLTESLPKLIADFADTLERHCVLRYAPRETGFYEKLLDRLAQPQLLRNSRSAVADLMVLHESIPANTEFTNQMHSLVSDEIQQLLHGNIPYFSYQAGSTTLQLSGGVIEQFFPMTGIDLVREKVYDFENSDVDEQSALITIALGNHHSCYGKSTFGNSVLAGTYRAPAASTMTKEQTLLSLGTYIVECAFTPNKAPARWLSVHGDVSVADHCPKAGDTSWFAGSWGIIMALEAIDSLDCRGKQATALGDFLDQQAERWQAINLKTVRFTLGNQFPGFTGVGGQLIAQHSLMRLNPKRWCFLHKHIEIAVEVALTTLTDKQCPNVVQGTAGLLLACNLLRSDTPFAQTNSRLLELHKIARQHLVHLSRITGNGIAWFTPGSQKPLLGYAHGWAGIVAALSDSQRYLINQQDCESVSSLLQNSRNFIERTYQATGKSLGYRDSESRNDPKREPDVSWCTGKTGLYRGLLAVQSTALECDQLLDEITASFENVQALRFCCGQMGMVDLLIDTADFHGYQDLVQARTLSIVDETMHQIHTGSKKPPELTFPGLFQGLAGIAYCATRVIRPELPSLSGQLSKTSYRGYWH